VLHGRASECAAIDALLDRSREARGGGLVLHGEPGIGKSSLLQYAGGNAPPWCCSARIP
jgi:predicted ATPase